MVLTKKEQKSADIYCCEKCHFSTSRKNSWERHINTKKHNSNNVKESVSNCILCSKCNKEYISRAGLWYHQKKCKTCIDPNDESLIIESKQIDQNMILEIIQQNKELQSIIMEQSKTIADLANRPSTIHNNTNNNKTKFNLNFFLNEKCKDAMNITDFAESIQLTLKDLEKTGEVGYIKGITNIIVNGLNEIDMYKRPIHCSDAKRETLYIKDNDAWQKENETRQRLKKAIQIVSRRNAKQLGEWQKNNKGYNISTNKKSDQYLKIVSEANGGDDHELNKIISNVSTHVLIDKEEIE
jgi:hypothetical protein